MGLYVERRGLSVEHLCEEKYDFFESLFAEIFLQPIDENLCPWKYFLHLSVHESFREQNRPILQINSVKA